MRHKFREADIRRKTRTKAISDFLRRVMTDRKLPSSTEIELSEKLLIVPKVGSKKQRREFPSPLTSTEMVTHKQGYDGDDDTVEGEEEKFGSVASSPRRCLNTQYGIHRDGEQLMSGETPVILDTDGHVTIKGISFERMEGLWEILTRNKVKTQLIGKEDLKL